jgi:lysozyme
MTNVVDTAVFDAVRKILIARTGSGFTQDDVRLINEALALDDPKLDPVLISHLSMNAALELFSHEAIIREAYKDSVGVWTWSAGLTAAAGVDIDQYRDRPASLQVCVDAAINRIEKRYLPEVLAAFKGKTLTESQLAAALSFHYNTGAIGRADWVKMFVAGKVNEAEAAIMNWKSPPEIVERREKEQKLFFHGVWSNDGKVLVYEVNKPSYSPKWSSAKRVDVTVELKRALRVV